MKKGHKVWKKVTKIRNWKKWKKELSSEKISQTSFKKLQKVTNSCKKDTNFQKIWQTCDRRDKLVKKYIVKKCHKLVKKSHKMSKAFKISKKLLKKYQILVPKY